MATDEPHEEQASDADPASSEDSTAAREDEPERASEGTSGSTSGSTSGGSEGPTSSDIESAGEAPATTEPGATADRGSQPTASRASRWWWALPVLLVAELYVYGHAGRVQICVGKEGETEFSLVGQERTDENRWKFPRCETRDNLGLRSQREAQVADATKTACRGATIFRHQGEAKACVAQEQGWQHQVEERFVPPWDPAYYRHLFWFFY